MSDWQNWMAMGATDNWQRTPWYLRLLGKPPFRRFHHTSDSLTKLFGYYGEWEYSE